MCTKYSTVYMYSSPVGVDASGACCSSCCVVSCPVVPFRLTSFACLLLVYVYGLLGLAVPRPKSRLSQAALHDIPSDKPAQSPLSLVWPAIKYNTVQYGKIYSSPLIPSRQQPSPPLRIAVQDGPTKKRRPHIGTAYPPHKQANCGVVLADTSSWQ